MSSPYGLYLDMQMVQYPFWVERGSIRYPREHARALARRPGLVRAAGMNPLMPLPRDLPPELAPLVRWGTSTAVRKAAEQGPLAYFLMSPFSPSPSSHLLPQFTMHPAMPILTTLVDVTPLAGIDPSFDDPIVARRYRSRFGIVERADLVLAISENTRREAIRLLGLDPERIVNVGSGVSPQLRPAEDPELPARLLAAELPELKKPFVLSVTGPWQWKNTHTLLDAFGRLPSDVRNGLQLVVACRLDDETRGRWTDLAFAAGLSEGEFLFPGLVTDDVLRALYQSAHLFVYPSLYEGFGLPALEAAACGCPVIVSGTSSMPEILNLDAAEFDPLDANDMSALIERGVSDTGFRVELARAAARAAKTHTWDAVADRTVEALMVLRDPVEGAQGPSTARPRIALVGAFAALEGGPFNPQVAHALAAGADVELWTTGSADRPFVRQATGLPCLPAAGLGVRRSPASYDAMIYVLDGGPAEGEVLRLAALYPGILWPQATGPFDIFPSFGSDRPDPLPLGRHVRGVVVSSAIQGRMLRMDQGPGAPMPPVAVVVPATPANGQPGRSAQDVAKEVLDFVAALPELRRTSA